MSEFLVATPDFYRYDWNPPATVRVDGRFVVMAWSDGAELRAFDLWLRENAVGAGGVDPLTREGLLDPADHDMATRVGSAAVGEAGDVKVRFEPCGTETTFHPGWLRHVADRDHLATAWLPEPVAWTAATLRQPPTHDGPSVLNDPAARRVWLNDLVSFGISRVQGIAYDPDALLELAAHIGAVRDTNFGPIWDVKADISLAGSSVTNSTANTSLRLGPHTDLPTRETPPGFQFLHCLVNETDGGESTMADGVAVVEALAGEHPEHYEALTTLRWVFFNRGPGIDHRWSGPMIDLGAKGAPLTLRAFYPVRGFPDMDPDDMARAYDAMATFSALAASDRFQLRYGFTAGDIVAFDNRRILHGREAFTAGGARHLRGTYIDHDEVRSATRVANRHHRGDTRP